MSFKIRSSILLFVAISARICAQTPQPRYDKNSMDVFAGGTFAVHSYGNNQDSTNNGFAAGWEAALDLRHAFHLPALGVTVDGSGYYGQHAHAYLILAGPQLSGSIGRETIFVHGLVGGAHLNGGSDLFPLMSNLTFAEAAGGGADTALTHRLAWRVAGDYLHTSFTAGGQETNQLQLVHNNFRVSTGIVFHF